MIFDGRLSRSSRSARSSCRTPTRWPTGSLEIAAARSSAALAAGVNVRDSAPFASVGCSDGSVVESHRSASGTAIPASPSGPVAGLLCSSNRRPRRRCSVPMCECPRLPAWASASAIAARARSVSLVVNTPFSVRQAMRGSHRDDPERSLILLELSYSPGRETGDSRRPRSSSSSSPRRSDSGTGMSGAPSIRAPAARRRSIGTARARSIASRTTVATETPRSRAAIVMRRWRSSSSRICRRCSRTMHIHSHPAGIDSRTTLDVLHRTPML